MPHFIMCTKLERIAVVFAAFDTHFCFEVVARCLPLLFRIDRTSSESTKSNLQSDDERREGRGLDPYRSGPGQAPQGEFGFRKF